MHFYTVKMQVVPMLNDHVGNKKPSENFLACRFIGTTQNVVCIFVILHLELVWLMAFISTILHYRLPQVETVMGASCGFNAKILMG